MKEQDGHSSSLLSLLGLARLRTIVMDLDGVPLAQDVGGGPEVSRGHLGRGRHLGREVSSRKRFRFSGSLQAG